MFDVSITDQGLWWMRDWNIETIFCKVQDWSDVNEGQYWVYAIGNDGCGARMALDSDYVYNMANDEAWGAYMIYLAKTIQHIRYRETVTEVRSLLSPD